MKLLLISMKDSTFIGGKLKEAAVHLGHEMVWKYYSNAQMIVGETVKIKLGEQDLGGFDAAVLRMTRGKSMIWYKDVIARELMRQGTFVLNGKSFIEFPYLGKIVQNYVLVQAGLPVVSTRLFASVEQLAISQNAYPLLIKPNFGRQGYGIKKIDSEGDIKQALKDDPGDYLVQKFLATGEDYRVIVVGGTVLPRTMKKNALPGSDITNYSQGGQVSGVDTTDQMRELAVKAAAAFGADYCGVDIMFDTDGKPHILEINRSANFKGFEEATGINVAEAVINYIESKI